MTKSSLLSLSLFVALTSTANAQEPIKPWIAPSSKLHQEIIEVAQFLHDHGMGDPRGGVFRKATIWANTVWDRDAAKREVVGWVLPAQNGEKPRVVTELGLLVEVEEVGPTVDIASEVEKLVANPKALQTRFFSGGEYLRFAMLLLINGNVDLAEKLCKGYIPTPDYPVFPGMARGFLTDAWDRAVTAHMRGDDQEALRFAKMLERYKADYDAYALKVGPKNRDSNPFSFLDPVSKLAEDSDRRVKAAQKPKLDLAALAKMPQKDRIEKLIDNLDEVDQHQQSQPGGVILSEDPIIKALIAEGDPAIEPLFTCMEKDTRLTRSVSFGRDFQPQRNLIAVKDAARSAFFVMVQAVDVALAPGQRATVEQLRESWKNNRGLTPAQISFKILSNDARSKDQWIEAAQRIFETSDVRHIGANLTRSGPVTGKLNAEVLRGKTNPSLTELITKRAIQLAGSGDPISAREPYYCTSALRIAESLALWDKPAALDLLRRITKRAMELSAVHYGSSYFSQIVNELSASITTREALGDKQAFTEYIQFIDGLKTEVDGFELSRVFEPFIESSSTAEAQRAVRSLLLTPGSTWNILKIAAETGGADKAGRFLASPILKFSAAREAALKLLQDKTLIGEVHVEPNGVRVVKIGNSGIGEYPNSSEKPDPLAPKIGERRDLRMCDAIADRLQAIKGIPAFKPYWPTKEKDLAVLQMIQYIEANASRMDDLATWWGRSPFQKAKRP